MRRYALAMVLATVLAGQKVPQRGDKGLSSQIGAGVVERAKKAVVMIDATVDGETRHGAGIILGLANDRVYIFTANHLVRIGQLEATNIEVKFRWSPGNHLPVPATLLNYYDDRILDLAVITVQGLSSTGTASAGLSLDQFGSPSLLAKGDPVWEIGYPNYTANRTSAGHVSVVEGVAVKFDLPVAVVGDYSGGPVLDRNGLIVGMIRSNQPDCTAIRIDLVVRQLKAWGYLVDLQKPPVTNAFRDALRLYVSEAPSGFVKLGARNSIGGWEPKVKLPNSRCKGHGTSKGASLECVVATEEDEVDADRTLDESISAVEAALPGWRGERMNGALWSAVNGPTPATSSVTVGVQYTRVDGGYEVSVTVYSSDDK